MGVRILNVLNLSTESIQKILVCQLRQIGDVLLSTVPIRLLARKFPHAEIHVLTEKKCTPMLMENPDVTRVWVVDKSELKHLGHDLAFSWRVARQDFDIVVDFQQLPRCRWVVAFSGARYRLSYPPPFYNRPLYTHWVVPDEGYAAMAKSSVLKPLGIAWNQEKPRLVLTDAEHAEARKVLGELGLTQNKDDIFVTIDPTHRRYTRKWPPEYFARLVALVGEQNKRIRFLLLYGPGEKEHVDLVKSKAITHGLPKERLLVPDRVLSLRQAAACIEQAAMHFGNCSAPRHLAVAVGTPSLVVLGATSSSWTFPSPEHRDISLGIHCQPCNKNTCPAVDCLTDLMPERVLPVFMEHFQKFGKE